jgi:hypothetical protein
MKAVMIQVQAHAVARFLEEQRIIRLLERFAGMGWAWRVSVSTITGHWRGSIAPGRLVEYQIRKSSKPIGKNGRS